MSIRFIYKAVAAAIITVSLTACEKNSFTIDGTAEDAAEKTIILERPDFNGGWVAIDSTHADNSGRFKIEFEAPAAPEIFRMRLGDSFVYVPIDSIDRVTFTAGKGKFATDFNLSGTDQAEKMTRFEREANRLAAISDLDSIDRFKRKVFTEIIKDGQGDLMSYYVLTKTIDNKYLFDPMSDSDRKYYAAVATTYKQFHPDDPRTRLLENTAIEAQRRRNSELGRHNVINASETALIDIELDDAFGNKRKLSEIAHNGKPTVLVFSVLTHPDSPTVNKEIAKINNRFAGQINIYQVCLDHDRFTWRDAAVNLPWTVVFDPDGEYSKNAAKYNVNNLPAAFIYDRKGELVARAKSFDDIEKHLAGN